MPATPRSAAPSPLGRTDWTAAPAAVSSPKGSQEEAAPIASSAGPSPLASQQEQQQQQDRPLRLGAKRALFDLPGGTAASAAAGALTAKRPRRGGGQQGSTRPVQVLLLSTQQGANGLNLTEAQHVSRHPLSACMRQFQGAAR